jgi:type II secretory pathway pseudopilin PulG
MHLPNKKLFPARLKLAGVSMLELMLVIVIITILVLGATRYFIVARDNLKITQALEMMNEVATASFEWVKGSQQGFSGISIGDLVDKNLLPAKYKNSDKINPWFGSIDLSGSDNDLKITMSNIPKDKDESTCNTLINKIQSSTDIVVTCKNSSLTVTFKAP